MKYLFSAVLSVLLLFSCTQKTPWMEMYVGTYTDGSSEGIYSLKFNPETGELDSLELKASLPNPSFLALSKNREFLYAVQETADFDSLGGGVTAFKVMDGLFEEINSKGSGGAHPCHVALSGEGQLAVSNYTGGNLAVFDILDDGSLGDRQLLNHNTDTLRKAHVHKAHFLDDELFVADLGLDVVRRYQKQPYGWIPSDKYGVPMPKGAGPRHFIFSADKSFLYVINELNATIAVLKRNAEENYNLVQTVSTVADDWTGVKSCADIHFSPDGRFLYGSNRGENTIVIYSVDGDSGELTLVGRKSVQGDWPRNFTFSPDGKHVLVANQKSNNITVFKRNTEDGTLEYTNQFELGAPVCLIFD